MLGIALIDKPAGISSHDVVNGIRRKLGTKRVGHAGTLDPIATGLLVIAVGPATRFLQYLSLEPKEYLCQVRFGISMDTQDIEGKIISESPVPTNIEELAKAQKANFLGRIDQVPPMYSAVKKDGKPLYTYARKGIEIERQARTVQIDQIEFEDWHNETAEIRVVCLGGTYMRTLAHDLGAAIGCGAHLSGLRRTRAGRFLIEEAVSMEELEANRLMPLSEALKPMKVLELSESEVAAIRHGMPIGAGQRRIAGKVALADQEGVVLGIAHADGPMLQPECVIPLEAADAAK